MKKFFHIDDFGAGCFGLMFGIILVSSVLLWFVSHLKDALT